MYGILLGSKTLIQFSPTINVIVFAVLGGIIYLFAILSLKVVDIKELKHIIKK
ncbi:flippase Wzx [Streptococcus pneumoniae]|nr:flippase Wzx [Streptococcus pneumoniae]